MKILIVSRTESGGGTEKHVREISEALRARSWDIHNYFIDNGGFRRLYSLIYRGRYDVVHFFLPRPYVLGSIACELAFHHNRIMSRRSLRGCYQTPLIRWIEERLHKRTKILVGNSPAVISELCDETWASKVQLIRNGIKPNPLAHIPSVVFRIICVGNAFTYKGHEDLVAAVACIGPKLPEPWSLTFVGNGTEDYDRRGWRVNGIGYRTDIPFLLAASDLFVLPSHEEGSSNALLEAMAAGIPVIATDVGGNRDMVIPGQTGVLVPPRDPEKLGLAILAMANDPAIRAELGAAGQTYVAKKFSFEKCVDEYESLYRSAA